MKYCLPYHLLLLSTGGFYLSCFYCIVLLKKCHATHHGGRHELKDGTGGTSLDDILYECQHKPSAWTRLS